MQKVTRINKERNEVTEMTISVSSLTDCGKHSQRNTLRKCKPKTGISKGTIILSPPDLGYYFILVVHDFFLAHIRYFFNSTAFPFQNVSNLKVSSYHARI